MHAPIHADPITVAAQTLGEIAKRDLNSRAAFIPASATWSQDMFEAGATLAIACGVPPITAYGLKSHELLSFYMASARSPDGGRKLAARKFPAIAPAPETPVEAPYSPSPVQIDLSPIVSRLDALEVSRAAMTGSIESAWGVAHAAHDKLDAITATLDAIQAQQPRRVEIVIADNPPIVVEHAHKVLPRVLRKCAKRNNIYLVGGMGTGKTTLAMQVAECLKLPFYMASTVFEEHKLFGFIDARGEYVTTDFRRAYEFGGLFLFDEFDRSDPSVCTAFNAALANGSCAFPDKLVKRHPDCVLIAAGNTPLRGATADFNTAQKADSSVLDRYAMIKVELDLELEAAICINQDWLKYCRALRAEVASNPVSLNVTPRASIEGAQAIADGDTWQEAQYSYIFKGLDDSTVARLNRAVPMSDYNMGAN